MAEQRQSLEELTLRQLRKVASDYNISRYSRMRKSQLLAAIQAIEIERLAPPLSSSVNLASQPTEEKTAVEASKFEVGQYDEALPDLASVDADLPDLPSGYGESCIVLMPRDPQWCYTYWDIPNDQKESLRRQGGQQLALRIYDVTNINLNDQNPQNTQEYPCDELAREWYLPIPISDRDYMVEIGYRCMDGRWLSLARSGIVRVPPVYPSDWIEDRFMTVEWEQELAGKSIHHFEQMGGESIEDEIRRRMRELEEVAATKRQAGSMFRAEESLSSYIFPSGIGQWASGAGMSGAGLTMSGAGMSGAGLTMSGAGMSGAGLTMSGAGVSGAGISGAGLTMSGAGISGAGLTMSGAGVSGAGMMSGYGMGETLVSGMGMMSGAGIMSGYGMGETLVSGMGMMSGAGIMSGMGLTASGAGLTMSGYGMSGFGMGETLVSGMGMMSGYGMGETLVSGMGMMSGAGLTMSGMGFTASGAGLTMSGYGMSGYGMSGMGMMSGAGLTASGSGMGMMSGMGLMSGAGLTASGSGMGMMSGYGMSGYGMSGMGMMSGAGLTASGSGMGMMSGAGLTASGSGMGMMSGYGMSGYGMSGMGMMSGAGLTASGSGMGMMSGAGLTMSGAGLSGLTMSGYNMSGVGFSASAPPIRPRKFWLVADAELIVYGATEPDATVTIGGRPIKLNEDGTFRFQMSFQDGQLDYPIMAVASDGEQTRAIHMEFERQTPSRHTNTREEATLEWFDA